MNDIDLMDCLNSNRLEMIVKLCEHSSFTCQKLTMFFFITLNSKVMSQPHRPEINVLLAIVLGKNVLNMMPSSIRSAKDSCACLKNQKGIKIGQCHLTSLDHMLPDTIEFHRRMMLRNGLLFILYQSIRSVVVERILYNNFNTFSIKVFCGGGGSVTKWKSNVVPYTVTILLSEVIYL